MKIIFYSDLCEHSKKMIAYLDKYNIKNLFKLINIDKMTPPKEIDIVPTIIDEELNQPLKGKKAFEYLLNLKYFNNPTNNIELVKEIPPNPEIPEDEKAQVLSSKLENYTSQISGIDKIQENLFVENTNKAAQFHEENKNMNVNKVTQQMVDLRNGQDKVLSLLLQMKR